MDRPSTSRDPLLTRGGDSESDGGESVEEHAYDYDFNAGESVYFTEVDEDQSLIPISAFTVVDSVDANVLKLPGENQRFICAEFSPDSKLAVTLTSDGTFCVWDVTHQFALVGSTRFQQDQRTIKRIVFDPYIEEAMLLCFDSGEIFRINYRKLRIGFRPSSIRAPGIPYMELVYRCEGGSGSRFDHFTFSPDRTIMVYYNCDGIFVRVQFYRQGESKRMTLSKDFILRRNPNVYVSEQDVLISATVRSSKDREPIVEEIETLFWSRDYLNLTWVDNYHVRLKGKGHLSGCGKYVLVSVLVVEHQSTCCQIKVYNAEVKKIEESVGRFLLSHKPNTPRKDNEPKMSMKHDPIATKTLKFASNHPHLECLDWNKFSFSHLDHEKIRPLIAIHQTISTKSWLMLWDTNSDTVLYEIDLTLDKRGRRFSEVNYCFSSNGKWLGVCSIVARMVGLVCVNSGTFMWTAHVPQISEKDVGLSTLSFNPTGTILVLFLDKMISLLEPPCLSSKPQKHPFRRNLFLTQSAKIYNDVEVFEMAKKFPKQVLFNLLLARQGMEREIWSFLADAAISLDTKSFVIVCQKPKGCCFLITIDYSVILSRELLWFTVLQEWNQHFFSNASSALVIEIAGEHEKEGLSVFYYHNEKADNEQIVLLSSKRGIKMLDLDLDLKELSEWTNLRDESCFSFTQSKDRRHVIALADMYVFIIDLNKKWIAKNVKYSFSLSQWWESFMDEVRFFAYSSYADCVGQESDKEKNLFLQEKFRGLFDVSDDGEMILIGWNKEQNKRLILTPAKSEEQFRIEWDEARESLYLCSMLTENGVWLGFIDYEKLRHGEIVICVVNTSSNCQQRVWLGSDELLVEPLSQHQFCTANFFFHLDEDDKTLIALKLEKIGETNKLKQFCVRLMQDDGCTQDHISLLETLIQPSNLDECGERNQPSIFNMRINGMSNFQRILIEEGEAMMGEIAKHALHNKIKISDTFLSCYDNKYDYTTILTHALETKNASLVKLCLRFIEDGMFPFHSTATMMKESFFDLLFSYNELFVPILKTKSFMHHVAEVKVPSQLFHSPNDVSNVVFTSDTMLEPSEHFVKITSQYILKLESYLHSRWIKTYKERMMLPSWVSFYCVADTCKIGLDGIIRRLLMLDAPLALFKTKLIRATISWKWERLWKRRCLHELCLYVFFLVLFTCYAIGIGLYGGRLVHDNAVQLALSFLLLGVVFVAIFFFYGECMQLTTYIKNGKEVFGSPMWGFKHYLWNSKWNLVDVRSYFLVLVLIPIFHGMLIFGKCLKKPLFVMVAIESLLVWFKLWYYAQPFEKTSALVLLIRNVLHDCRPFLGLAFVILFGFSVSLYVIFQCCSPPSRSIGYMEATEIIEAIRLLSKAISKSYEKEGVTEAIELLEARVETRDELEQIEENEVKSFGSPWRSLSTMFYAMLGEFEPEVYYNHQCLPWLTTLVFILYMALEMIVMLNMLIAIMGDTFDRVKSEEDTQIIFGRAAFIDACEASLSKRQIREIEKQIGKFLYVLTPKDCEQVQEKISWKGKINVIEENVKKAIKDNKEDMVNEMRNHFQQLESIIHKSLEHKSHEEKHWKKD